MRKITFLFSSISALALIILATSCKKNNDDDTTYASSDMAISDIAFNDVYKVMDEAASGQSDLKAPSWTLNCATVTLDTAANPKKLTVDFGSTNCTCNDGRIRRGVIEATFTGRYRDSGTVIVITPINYHLNNYKVEGTQTVENMGRNNSGNLWYNVTIANGKVTEPGGAWFITRESERTREWVEGESTILNVWDDVYLIDGWVSGVDRNGNSWYAESTSPLRVEIGCKWITSGTFELTPQNLSTRTVDYGNGNCDNQATVSVNGTTYQVSLP